jgi:hypothetical protein
MEMNAQVTKIQAAENDLKQLMAEVTRTIDKGSASRGEDILQGRGGHNGARIHLALERVLMIAPADARFPGVRLCDQAEAFNAWPCRHHAGRWFQTPNLPDGA